MQEGITGSQALCFLFCFAACKSSANTRDIFHSISHGEPGLIFSQLLASYLLGIKIEWSEWKKKGDQNKAKQISLSGCSQLIPHNNEGGGWRANAGR